MEKLGCGVADEGCRFALEKARFQTNQNRRSTNFFYPKIFKLMFILKDFKKPNLGFSTDSLFRGLLLVFLFGIGVSVLQAQNGLPPNFQKDKEAEYKKIADPEVSFQKFLELETAEYFRLKELEQNPSKKYAPKLAGTTPCGGGNFVGSAINTAEWQGAHGVQVGGNPDFTTLTAGIVAGNQTIVTSGYDPVLGGTLLPMLPPVGSGNAVRIGNNGGGGSVDVLSKTFTVPSGMGSVIGFWYAVVFEDPGHADIKYQPSFWVRVVQGSTEITPYVVNLDGAGNPKISANGSAFFQQKGNLRYKNWTCSQINLSNYVGQVVTVQFVAEDCGWTQHYGYAYVDEFCTDKCSGSEGSISYNALASSCQNNKVCFNYTLPQAGGVTGTIQIKLDIFQNGNSTPVATLNSPVLSSGTSYCFTLDPCTTPGVNTSLGGIDFMATASFTHNSTSLPPKTAGVNPEGVVAGKNNDCRKECPPKYCCPGENRVKNGDFEGGNTGFTSQHSYESSTASGAVTPGEYAVVTGTQAQAINGAWQAHDPSTCSGSVGKFLVVNGNSNISNWRLIWRTTVPVKDWGKYKFCFQAKSLKAATVASSPKIEIRFPGSGVGSSVETINTAPATCTWQTINKSVDLWGSTTNLVIEIWLDESTQGMNDLALDNMALLEVPQCPASSVIFNISTATLSATHFKVNATSIAAAPCSATWWEVCEVDNTTLQCSGNKVSNPSDWWSANTSFKTYNSGTPDGKFEFGKLYKITRGTWGDCQAWNQFSMFVGSSAALKKPKFYSEEEVKKNKNLIQEILK